MSMPITGKRVTFELELYWRGKKKTPSVNAIFAGDNYEGLPNEILDGLVYKEFNKAAHNLCKELVDAGELD